MSIFILLIGGFITKIFGFLIKILFTRTIGQEGISLYTIVMPTYSLLITIATFALPISISKLVSENKIRSKTIVFSTACFILLFNAVFIIFILFLAPVISKYLLKQPNVTPLIWAMAATLPFISISSILKGYFLGKFKVAPNTISNIFEQLFRIFFLIVILPYFAQKNVMLGVILFILVNVITELISIFTFSLFLPKKAFLHKEGLTVQKNIINRVLSISIPSVSSRFIGNIGFFLEPIILTNLLLFSGYSNNFILTEYAAYNAYAIGLLTLPSFFVSAISQILIPEISKFHAKKETFMIKKRLKQALIYSFLIGLVSSVFILWFRNPLLMILYKTTNGSDYILALAPFFVLFYLEAPLSSTLQALDKSKTAMKITLYGMILKLVLLTILSLAHIGLYSLVISEIINIIFVVLAHIQVILKYFQNSFEI
ncbi:TPA: oligosaccharide flippase family protein [Candidatus Ventrenecus avicola]|nr:oligosaccharide flippase family protein [Candidatus Ventrenecus avicola]